MPLFFEKSSEKMKKVKIFQWTSELWRPDPLKLFYFHASIKAFAES